jgi:gliding motility-associated-like protein
MLKQLRTNPAYVSAEKKMNDDIHKFIMNKRNPNRIVMHGTLPADPVILPVVVHIIRDDPSETAIPTLAIKTAIDDLNHAFGKTGPYAASKGVDTKIRFALAQKDPDGGRTTGITRTTTHYGVNLNYYNEEFDMKNLVVWDQKKYINIWVVENMVYEFSAYFQCGDIWRRKNAGGVATMPFSVNPGSNDGIVVAGFGSVLWAHEMGHYLGLYHTFNGGCTNNNCETDGDMVCDTPPDTSDDPSDCNQPQNSCRGNDTSSNYSNGFFPRDTVDQERNFMDYGACQDQFTQGQAERIHATIATLRPGLISDATIIPAPCTGTLVASFTRDFADPKPSDNITFTSTSAGANVATVYQWTVNGLPAGSGPTISRPFPNLLSPPFNKHKVTLKVTGGGCVSTFTDYIITNCGITARFSPNKRFIASLSGIKTDTILFTNNTTSTVGQPDYKWVLVNMATSQRISITTNAAQAGGGAVDAKHLNYEFQDYGFNLWVRLIASASGCADSISMNIPVDNPRPDANIGLFGANCFQNTKVRASFYICNSGYDTIMPGLPVTFYDDDPTKPNAKKIGSSFILPEMIGGYCCKTYIDTVDVGYEKLDKLYAVVNNTTSSVPVTLPDNGVTLLEKEYSNNIASYTGFRYRAVINPATATMAPGDTLQLNATGTPDGSNSFTWGPSGNFSCSTCATTFYYADTTPVSTKRVIVRSQYQCTDTGYIDIKVPPYNDFNISIGGISCSPNEDSLFVDFTVGNLFKRGIIPKNLEVAFYKGDPRTGTAVPLGAVFKVPDSVAAKQKAYRIKIKKTRNSSIYASVNDQGTVVPVVPANAPFAESVYTNNFASAVYQPVIVATVDTAICSGLSYRGYSVTGIYRDTVLSASGCDSISVINLTVKAAAAVRTTINVTLCEGETYAGHTASGTYVETYTGSNTCDSIRTLHLTVNPIVRITRNVKICIGKSFFAAGKFQTDAGTYLDSAKSAKGCDSIVTTILTVDPLIPIRYTVSICQGTAHPAAGKMQTQSGVYTDTTLSSAGCDSITITTLNVRPVIRADYNVGICRGESYFAGGQMQTQSGVYTDATKTAGGCDSITVTHLSVNPLPARFLPDDTTLCVGRPLTIDLIGFTSINWNTGSTLNTVTLTQAGTYSVQVVDRNGCAGSDAIVVEYKKCIPLQVPGAFTPNNDGLNDDFKPMIGVVPTTYIMQIFNRWGTLMFETHEPNKGWNGKTAGQLQPAGTYVYSISLTDVDGTMAARKGTLVLIR